MCSGKKHSWLSSPLLSFSLRIPLIWYPSRNLPLVVDKAPLHLMILPASPLWDQMWTQDIKTHTTAFVSHLSLFSCSINHSDVVDTRFFLSSVVFLSRNGLIYFLFI